MQDKKNYNMAALMGGDIDDMDYVEELGLDPSSAYTPYINVLILDKVEKDNTELFMQGGDTPEKAASKAKANRQQSFKTINERLAAKGML